jgi:hypothetical protein
MYSVIYAKKVGVGVGCRCRLHLHPTPTPFFNFFLKKGVMGVGVGCRLPLHLEITPKILGVRGVATPKFFIKINEFK